MIRIGCHIAMTAALALFAGACADEDDTVRDTTIEPGQATIATITVEAPPITMNPADTVAPNILPPTASPISRSTSTSNTVGPPSMTTVAPTDEPTIAPTEVPSEPAADPNP